MDYWHFFDDFLKTGPAQWGTVSAQCSGRAQSPVNVVTRTVLPDGRLTPFQLTGYRDVFDGLLQNNGHTGTSLMDCNLSFMEGFLWICFEILALLFPSSVEFTHQYKSKRGESSCNIQGASAPPALGHRRRPGFWTHHRRRTIPHGGMNSSRAHLELRHVIHMGLNHFSCCLDAHSPHKREISLHIWGFKGPHRSSSAGILLPGDFTFFNLQNSNFTNQFQFNKQQYIEKRQLLSQKCTEFTYFKYWIWEMIQ